jgi:hypothetical protein
MRTILAIAAIVLVNAAFAAQETSPQRGGASGATMQGGQSAQQCQQQVNKIHQTVTDLSQQLSAVKNSNDPQALRAALDRVERGLDQIETAAMQSRGGRMQDAQRMDTQRSRNGAGASGGSGGSGGASGAGSTPRSGNRKY